MESDDQNIMGIKAKRNLKIASIFIIIMMLLIDNNFFKCYAVTAFDVTDYKVEENRTVLDGIKREVFDTLNIKVDGYEIVIQGNTFGYVESKEQKDEILQQVCEMCIEQLSDIYEGENYSNINIMTHDNLDSLPRKRKTSEL